MIIECYRGAGDRTGHTINAPLLADDALIHRGRADMDANAHELNRVDLSIVFRAGVRLGQLIEANDPATGLPWRGKVVGMQISIRQSEIEQTLNVEVPV